MQQGQQLEGTGENLLQLGEGNRKTNLLMEEGCRNMRFCLWEEQLEKLVKTIPLRHRFNDCLGGKLNYNLREYPRLCFQHHTTKH